MTRKIKRKLIRAVISFFIISVFIITVFWFGWIQFKINEGEYAVVYTKSHGYEKEPVKYGEFAWRWQALLPTNLNLHKFKIARRTLQVNQSGLLPSGDYYTRIIGENVDFSWKLRANLIYQVNPDKLPGILGENGIRTNLQDYFDNFESFAESSLTHIVIQELEQNPSADFMSHRNRLQEKITDELSSSQPEMIVADISISQFTYPDPKLYLQAQQIANAVLERRESIILESQRSIIEQENIQKTRLEVLNQYGKILNDYPVLIDILSLQENPAEWLLP